MDGERIIKSISTMHDRSNGLGGGFAAYGIYPRRKDLYALHVFYDSVAAKEAVSYTHLKTIDANMRFFGNKEDVTTRAYTMGIKNIMNARRILLVAYGEGKSDIIYRMAVGAIEPQVPASILQLHNNVTVIADEAALEKMMEKAPHLIDKLPDWKND